MIHNANGAPHIAYPAQRSSSHWDHTKTCAWPGSCTCGALVHNQQLDHAVRVEREACATLASGIARRNGATTVGLEIARCILERGERQPT